MIREAAYFKARSRGAGPGDAMRDWLDAEVEVDSRIAANGGGRPAAAVSPRRRAR